jgi:stage V sporulation protein G
MANYEINKVNKDTGEVTGVMNIEVRAYPIAEPKGNTKGYASVTIDDMFAAGSIAIKEGKNGLFAAMPQTRDSKGGFRDLFFPVTKEAREVLQGAALKEFGKALNEMVVQKESTVQKLRDSASAVKEQTAPPTPTIETTKPNKKNGPEL